MAGGVPVADAVPGITRTPSIYSDGVRAGRSWMGAQRAVQSHRYLGRLLRPQPAKADTGKDRTPQ
jgi:hypothetical protein